MILEIKLLKIILQNYSSNLFYFSGFDQGNSALLPQASSDIECFDISQKYHVPSEEITSQQAASRYPLFLMTFVNILFKDPMPLTLQKTKGVLKHLFYYDERNVVAPNP